MKVRIEMSVVLTTLFLIVGCVNGDGEKTGEKTSINQLQSQQLAFPTAEGYGKYVTGGRGGAIYEVTNLKASGTGSLGAAISASGPRTVVFRVAGTITGDFSIKNGDITIAGQTAPGDGITIKGNLSTNADNIIIRYIRVRHDPKIIGDAIGGRYHKNIIIDHVSTSWSADEVFTLYHNEYTTVQWCIIAQGCEKSGEGHRFGGIWGNNYGTWHHNLLAHNDNRNPRWASGCGYNDYRNNVIYNWGYGSCYGGEKQQPGNSKFSSTTINMIANYYKYGPATDSGIRDRIANPSARSSGDKGDWYVADNYVYGFPAVTANNWQGVVGSKYIQMSAPWNAMPINQQSPQDAYQAVLDHAGCSFPKRDKVDIDIIDDTRTGKAKYGNNGIIDVPGDVGGWPVLAGGTPPADSDHDGMPDSWELSHGLNPNDASDRNKIGADGYTMVEVYINGLVDGTQCDPEPVSGVNVSPVTKNVGIGGTTQLTATVEPDCAGNKNVSWSSGNTSVATVNSSGLVTGVGYGTAVITVTTQEGGFTAQSTVTVAVVPVTGVTVTPTSATVMVGGTTQLTASVAPENAGDKTVTWSSSNSAVASVNSSGLVTGHSLGLATITVTTEDGAFTATCDVTVSNIIIKTITIQENETGVASYDGSIDDDHSGHTGDGYINTPNSNGSGITWKISAASTGTYTLVWRFANGGSANRTAQVEVDGSVAVSNVDFPSTGAWNSWDNSSTVDVTLSSGTHQVRLEATNSSGLANIDYISITGNNL